MAAPAPAAPMPAADVAPAAKRQRLATQPPPQVKHTWTLDGLTLASFTDAARDERWDGPVFEACGLRWRLEVRPHVVFQDDPHVSF